MSARHRIVMKSICLLLLLNTYVLLVEGQAYGLVHTESGYDTVEGRDAICWFAPSYSNHTTGSTDDTGADVGATVGDFTGARWGGFLVPSFVAGPTKMLPRCAVGMDLHLDTLSPVDERLRQWEPVSYHLWASVNLAQLRDRYGLSEDAFFYSAKGPQVAFQITFCPHYGNLCSPFSRKDPLRRRRARDLFPLLEQEEEPEAEIDAVVSLKRLQIQPSTDAHRELQITTQQVGPDSNVTRHKGEDYQKPKSYLVGSPMLMQVPLNYTDMDYLEFHIDYDLEFAYVGSYLPLATIQFFLDNGTSTDGDTRDNSTLIKLDMANLLHQRTQVFFPPMQINEVSDAVAILTYVMVAVATAIELTLMGGAIYYRKEGVMKLSQGGFLIFLLACGAISCCCTVLYNPVSDLACRLQGFLIKIPVQLMLATVYGRLRRIYIVMAPLMNWNDNMKNYQTKQGLKRWRKAFMTESTAASSSSISTSAMTSGASQEGAEQGTSTPSRMARRWTHWTTRWRRQTSIRQTYSATRLRIVIGLVTLPVVVVEIIAITAYSADLTLNTNEDEHVGRYECGTMDHKSLVMASTVWIVITVFLAIYEANRSRNLPGLFNEADSLSSALTASLLVICMGLAVVFVTSDPEDNPGIMYLFQVIIVCFIAVNLSVRLMWPKFQLIWKGEKVVLSRMLAEHKQQSIGSRLTMTSGVGSRPYGAPPNVTTSTPLPSRTSSSQNDAPMSETEKPDVPTGEEETKAEDLAADTETQPDPADETARKDGPRRSVTIEQGAVDADEFRKSHKSRPNVVIKSGQQPPSKVVMQVLSISKTTSRINERILSGLQVSREDWDDLKQSAKEMEELLANAEYQ